VFVVVAAKQWIVMECAVVEQQKTNVVFVTEMAFHAMKGVVQTKMHVIILMKLLLMMVHAGMHLICMGMVTTALVIVTVTSTAVEHAEGNKLEMLAVYVEVIVLT
jgi:hypothetical protein